MSEALAGGPEPAVGALSPDGSRKWDGHYWVLLNPVSKPAVITERAVPARAPAGSIEEPRGAYVGGVIFAAILGVGMSYFKLNLPAIFLGSANSIADAFARLALAEEIWNWISFSVVVLVLSVGRQGIDVLLIRSMTAAFVIGVGYSVLFPIWMFSIGSWLLVMLIFGVLFAVILGPVLTMFAAIPNLVWYRSLHSLRPQLGIFNRPRRQ